MITIQGKHGAMLLDDGLWNSFNEEEKKDFVKHLTKECQMGEGYFFSNYGLSGDAIKSAKKNLVEAKIRRNFESAYDSAESQRLNAEEQLTALRQNLDGFDINAILSQIENIRNAEDTKAAIKAEYELAFGDALKR